MRWQSLQHFAIVVLLSNTTIGKFMARVTSVTLGEHFNGFVGDMIQSGRYGNTSEVVRDALRLMEAREQRMQNVREMVLAGLNSPASKNSMDDIFARAAKDLNV
jgi:antitoxin ParD1/3/4